MGDTSSMKQALLSFIQLESAGGIILGIAAICAVIAENSGLSPLYHAALHYPIAIGLGDSFSVSMSAHHWINDALMVLFFFLVGLEIKREVQEGELSQLSQITLPAAAALGGMVVPAILYVVCSLGDPAASRGWAIPAATDIAFSLGILSLLGNRVPVSLKVFLTALAIFDDVGAIVVIALFYSHEISVAALGGAGGILVIAAGLAWRRVSQLWPYLLLGFPLWVFVYKSGIHATVAGVLLAACIPLRSLTNPDYSPLRTCEHAIHPWIVFGILPLFAFANAGVNLSGLSIATLFEPVPLGILVGLFVGKQIGIFGITAILIRSGFATLPMGASWMQLYGVSLLAGVGFTMSLFIGALALDSPEYTTLVRLGVIAGSLLSGAAGYVVLRMAASRTN
jgi:NhaA family Na+:H+ antiporter